MTFFAILVLVVGIVTAVVGSYTVILRSNMNHISVLWSSTGIRQLELSSKSSYDSICWMIDSCSLPPFLY